MKFFIVLDLYLFFVMLFMQLRGLAWSPRHVHPHEPGNNDDQINLTDYRLENYQGTRFVSQRRDITEAQGGKGDIAEVEITIYVWGYIPSKWI